MKGLTHFVVGVAAASCFPSVLRHGADHSALYLALGGIFGILPDTLDFKVVRYLYRHDVTVTPDPLDPDPQLIADGVAAAFNRAVETGRPVRLKLDTVSLGPDTWQQYHVTFDIPAQAVVVTYGPAVDTGRLPLEDHPVRPLPEGRARLHAPVVLDYAARTTIDIFEGPVFDMRPRRDGRVVPVFIPWHRQWTHGVPLALGFAVAGGILWDLTAARVIAAAHVFHAVFDQLGFLGNNFFFPLQRRRTPGFGLAGSGDPLPNLATIWCALLLIFWNLYRAQPVPSFELSLPGLLVFAGLIPLVVGASIYRWLPG